MRARALTVLAGAITLAATFACGGDMNLDGSSDGSDLLGGDFIGAGISAIPDGGSGDWDTAVSALLVGAYDSNGSGSIDTPSEVQGIPCSTLEALDKGVRDGWGTGIRTIDGFREDFSWVGSAIGLDEVIRGEADARFASCGIDET